MAEQPTKELHVIVVPFDGQGHINPMLQFAKRLASKGVHITLATNLSNTHKLHLHGAFTSIAVESVYDDTALSQQLAWKDRQERFRADATENIGRLITTAREQQHRVAVVYDANLQWVVEVAKKHGVPAAAFSTQACATFASYYRLYLESVGEDQPAAVERVAPSPSVLPSPRVLQEGISRITGLFSPTSGELHPLILMLLEQFQNLDKADWVLFNSFTKLEEEVVKWLENLWPVRTIGPTVPSVYLDKRVQKDVNYGFNQYNPDNDGCMSWLSTKAAGSVVYVAFGSAANLSEEQMAEIAEALKRIPSSLLWVVRETEKKKLPANFISEITSSDKGLVVSWCPQLDVLAHRAIGCFVSHCGWNSTVEALSFGVPVLAMPQFLDQMIDAHFVEQVWGVGIKPKANEKGFITREELERCIKEIMQGERAEKIKENAAMWRALAKEAVDEGGISDKNIDEIITCLASI